MPITGGRNSPGLENVAVDDELLTSARSRSFVPGIRIQQCDSPKKCHASVLQQALRGGAADRTSVSRHRGPRARLAASLVVSSTQRVGPAEIDARPRSG